MKMTPEIAIEKIKHLGLYYAAKEEWPTFVSVVEAFEMAIEALKKDIPIKPIQCATPRYCQGYIRKLKKDIPIKSILRKYIHIKSVEYVNQEYVYYDWKCPKCNHLLALETEGKKKMAERVVDRCSCCGQLIEWCDSTDDKKEEK